MTVSECEETKITTLYLFPEAQKTAGFLVGSLVFGVCVCDSEYRKWQAGMDRLQQNGNIWIPLNPR